MVLFNYLYPRILVGLVCFETISFTFYLLFLFIVRKTFESIEIGSLLSPLTRLLNLTTNDSDSDVPKTIITLD